MKNIILGMLISLFLFSNSNAEIIILKCQKNVYKYVNDNNEIKTFQAVSSAGDVWMEWPKTKVQDDNKHFLKFTDAESIIDGYVVTEKFKKLITKSGIAKNGRTIVDFKNKSYDTKGTWKGKPYKKKAKCLLIHSE